MGDHFLLGAFITPRVQLYMEVASDCDDHWLRVDLCESKSEQGPRWTVLKKWILSSSVRP